MQNQMQFPNGFSNNPSPILGSPKFNTQNYNKTFEKVPPNPLKHYSSNPNLSLEMPHPRPQNYPQGEHSPYGNNLPNKNMDFRMGPGGMGIPGMSPQSSTRGNRSELTKSLMISDLDKH